MLTFPYTSGRTCTPHKTVDPLSPHHMFSWVAVSVWYEVNRAMESSKIVWGCVWSFSNWALFLAFQIAHVVVAHCSSSFIVNFSSNTWNSWKKSHLSFLHFCTFPLDRAQTLRANGHSHSRFAPISGCWRQNSQFLSTSTLCRCRLIKRLIWFLQTRLISYHPEIIAYSMVLP